MELKFKDEKEFKRYIATRIQNPPDPKVIATLKKLIPAMYALSIQSIAMDAAMKSLKKSGIINKIMNEKCKKKKKKKSLKEVAQ
jgi:hypothetical protein